MNKPKLYFVTGISGSGKTTVARKLLERGCVAFDSKVTKGIFHFADKNGNQAPDYRPHNETWIHTYKWVLNIPLLEILIEQNKDADSIFLCGRGNIRQHWDLADKVFLLKVDAATMLERLNRLDRDNDFAKDRATQTKLVNTLDFVQRTLINAGAIPIDAKRPIEEVASDIQQQVGMSQTHA